MRLLRSGLVFIVLLFALLNMHVLLNLQAGPSSGNRFRRNGMQHNHQLAEEGHVQFQIPQDDLRDQQGNWLGNDQHQGEPGLVIPPVKNMSHWENRTFPVVDITNLTMIRAAIKKINDEQHIYNLRKFGLKLNSESTVIVIQAHNRAEYLKILLDSLRNVRGIERALVIVSHDVYSETLNTIVQSVDFCPVSSPHSDFFAKVTFQMPNFFHSHTF